MFGVLSIIVGVALTWNGCSAIPTGGYRFDPSATSELSLFGPGLVVGGIYWVWPRRAKR